METKRDIQKKEDKKIMKMELNILKNDNKNCENKFVKVDKEIGIEVLVENDDKIDESKCLCNEKI